MTDEEPEPEKFIRVDAKIGNEDRTFDYFPTSRPTDAIKLYLDSLGDSLDLEFGRLELTYAIATREEMLAQTKDKPSK